MALGKLVCGGPVAESLANTTLNHLEASIERFSSEAISFLNGDFSESAQKFGAFCSRVTLENSCAALVGRYDPFRILYLSEFQAQGTFQYGKPSKSGFRWSGDVIPDDKMPQEMWGTDHDTGKVSRALFSHYSEHVYWRPAMESALDAIASEDPSLFADLTSLDPASYTGYTRGKCASIYSTLSKGVHWDFFVSAIVMDEGTLKDTIRDCLIVIAGLGLVSHFVPTAFRSLAPQEAVETYKALRGLFP